VQQLLGKGSMQELAVPLPGGTGAATGCVPQLEHAAFVDIDLWG
jgi:hypothetical protein